MPEEMRMIENENLFPSTSVLNISELSTTGEFILKINRLDQLRTVA